MGQNPLFFHLRSQKAMLWYLLIVTEWMMIKNPDYQLLIAFSEYR